MQITNINQGLCHYRTVNSKPAFFVNWQDNGEQKYQYFTLRSACESFYQKILKQQKTIKC